MWAYPVAAILALHGLIHSLGFFATWRIGNGGGVAASPNLLPSFRAGSQPVLALGVLWLVAMAVFLLSAIGLSLNAPWWRVTAGGAAVMSLALCIAWWNNAKFGALINIAILLGIVVSAVLTRPATA